MDSTDFDDFGDVAYQQRPRSNTWSFQSRWQAKFNQAENMDFTDNHDSWSMASYDSTCSSEMDTQPFNLPRRSSLKDLTKLADSMHNLDHSQVPLSPQSTPGLSRRVTENVGLSNTLSNHGNNSLTNQHSNDELKDKNKGGLSHSMILNWLSFKRYQHYPTIAESSESPSNTPVDESTMDSVISVIANPATSQMTDTSAINTSGKLFEAATSLTANTSPPPVVTTPNVGMRRNQSSMEFGSKLEPNVGMKRNYSMKDMSGAQTSGTTEIKRTFSFKDLNAVAPSGW